MKTFDMGSLVSPSHGTLVSDGWVGLEPERQWAEIVAYRIREKLTKLCDHYQKAVTKCDLLLYSDVHAPVLELETAVKFLRERMASASGMENHFLSFRRVSIVCESWAIFDTLAETKKIVVKNGWPFKKES